MSCIEVPTTNSSDFQCIESTLKEGQKFITLVEYVVPDHLGATERLFLCTKLVGQYLMERFLDLGIRLIRCESKSFTPLAPAKAIEISKENGSLATIGFAWSTIASMAATKANEIQQPYFSATSVTNDVHKGPFSFSLGISPEEATEKLLSSLRTLRSPVVICLFNPTNRHEIQYVESLESKYNAVIRVEFDQKIPSNFAQIIAQAKNPVLFIPGYNFVINQLNSILDDHKDLFVFVGPQWAHDPRNSRSNHEKIFSISNYFNVGGEEKQFEVRNKLSPAHSETVDGYFFALLDTAMFVANLATKKGVNNTQQFLQHMDGYNFTESVVKGTISVKSGSITKPTYLTKYLPHKGFSIIENGIVTIN